MQNMIKLNFFLLLLKFLILQYNHLILLIFQQLITYQFKYLSKVKNIIYMKEFY
jgi:hypothetical protein